MLLPLVGFGIAALGALTLFGFVVYAMYDMGGWWGLLYLLSLLMIVGGFALIVGTSSR